MRIARLYLVYAGLTALQACDSSRPQATASATGSEIQTYATARRSLRVEALGCWELTREAGSEPGLLPSETKFVRIDSAVATNVGWKGERVLQRLDSAGRVMRRDAEGFSVQDHWSADSSSNRVYVAFNNGLYGSVWVLNLPAESDRTDMMRGESQNFGDVVPAPPEPVRASVARRIGCR